MGVDLHVTWEGLACSARHFRILPDTPVVTRVWLSQTADSFSHPHDAARTSVLALREDSPDRVASPHCRKAGNGYPKLVCLLSSVRQGHATHGVCLHRSYKHSPNPMMRIGPKMGPKMGVPGGSKKRAQTVPTGRVIKYPKKCALFAPPRGGPRGAPRGAQKGHPRGPPWEYRNIYIWPPKWAPKWAPKWGPGGAPRGPPAGAPGRPGPGPEIFPEIFPGPRRAPRPGGVAWAMPCHPSECYKQ